MTLKVPRPQGDLFVLGLSRPTIEKMMEDGLPVRVNLARLGGEQIEIDVYVSESREDLVNELAKSGLVPNILP